MITAATLSAPVVPASDTSEFGRNVYVASLPPEFDDDSLLKLFQKYGEVCSARIMREKGTRRSKGYGFVLFQRDDCAAAAVKGLVGHSINNTRIQVRLARPDACNAYSEVVQSQMQRRRNQTPTVASSWVAPHPVTLAAPVQVHPPPASVTDPNLLMHSLTASGVQAFSPVTLQSAPSQPQPQAIPIFTQGQPQAIFDFTGALSTALPVPINVMSNPIFAPGIFDPNAFTAPTEAQPEFFMLLPQGTWPMMYN